jgi:hypothetical protein
MATVGTSDLEPNAARSAKVIIGRVVSSALLALHRHGLLGVPLTH